MKFQIATHSSHKAKSQRSRFEETDSLYIMLSMQKIGGKVNSMTSEFLRKESFKFRNRLQTITNEVVNVPSPSVDREPALSIVTSIKE